MKKLAAVVIASALLSACVQPPYARIASDYDQKMAEAKKHDAEFSEKVRNINLETADVGEKPKNYKELVQGTIKDALKDPDSAKFSDFSPLRKEVMVENRNFVYGYSTCVFVNAKNSYGGYTGKQLYWAFIRNGQVLRFKNTNDEYGDLIFVGRKVNCN